MNFADHRDPAATAPDGIGSRRGLFVELAARGEPVQLGGRTGHLVDHDQCSTALSVRRSSSSCIFSRIDRFAEPPLVLPRASADQAGRTVRPPRGTQFRSNAALPADVPFPVNAPPSGSKAYEAFTEIRDESAGGKGGRGACRR
jgi:hypothetical protein